MKNCLPYSLIYRILNALPQPNTKTFFFNCKLLEIFFKLTETSEVDRSNLKADYICCSPASLNQIDTTNNEFFTDSVIFLKDSYLELNFEVVHADDSTVFAVGGDIRVVNSGSLALFSEFKLSTSSGKSLESNDHPKFVSLLYKLKNSTSGEKDLSIGFGRGRGRRREELTNRAVDPLPTNIRGYFNLRKCLKNVFGFSEHQENATYGLGHKLTLKKNTDNVAIIRSAATADAKLFVKYINQFVPRYVPNTTQERILAEQIVCRAPIQLTTLKNLFFKKI